MALIDGSPRMATAVAVEATTVLMVKGEELQAKLDRTDPFVARLLGMRVNNIRRITDEHVQGKALTFWDAVDTLDLGYSPDEISQALAVGPYIRRDADNAAKKVAVQRRISTLKFQAMEMRSPSP